MQCPHCHTAIPLGFITQSLRPLYFWAGLVLCYLIAQLFLPQKLTTFGLKSTCSAPHAAVTCTEITHGENDKTVFTLQFSNLAYLTEFEILNHQSTALPASQNAS